MDQVTLDHLAIGVERWPDTYRRFVTGLGGQWSHGGDAGGYAPCQFIYQHGMRLEFITPSSDDGFMRRFMDRGGPGAHHLTFKVPSLDRALAEVAALGIEPFGERTSAPGWHEVFLHPKSCELGTLVQIVEVGEEFPLNQPGVVSPPPDDFPVSPGPQHGLSWIGVTARSLPRTRALLVDVLGATVADSGEHWILLTWGAGRSLLVRDEDGTPGGAALWDGAPSPGVAHIVFGPPGLSPRAHLAERLPHDELTGIPVWISPDPAVTAG